MKRSQDVFLTPDDSPQQSIVSPIKRALKQPLPLAAKLANGFGAVAALSPLFHQHLSPLIIPQSNTFEISQPSWSHLRSPVSPSSPSRDNKTSGNHQTTKKTITINDTASLIKVTSLLLLSMFQSLYPSLASLEYFIKEVLKRSKCSLIVFQISIYYLVSLLNSPKLDSSLLKCPKKAWLGCLILAGKFHQDKNYTMKVWNKITGSSIKELNSTELTILDQLNYHLFVKDSKFNDFLYTLQKSICLLNSPRFNNSIAAKSKQSHSRTSSLTNTASQTLTPPSTPNLPSPPTFPPICSTFVPSPIIADDKASNFQATMNSPTSSSLNVELSLKANSLAQLFGSKLSTLITKKDILRGSCSSKVLAVDTVSDVSLTYATSDERLVKRVKVD